MAEQIMDVGLLLTDIGSILIKYLTIPIVVLFVIGVLIDRIHTKYKLNQK